MRTPTLLAVLLLSLLAQAQNHRLDSLRGVWADPSRPDTVRLVAFADVIWGGYLFSDPDSARILADSLYREAMRKDLKANAGDALSIHGISYIIVGQFDSALLHLDKARAMFMEAGSLDGVAGALNNMGNAYWKKGDLSRAIELYTQALQIAEKLGKKKGIAAAELNIGLIYSDLQDTLRAMQHYRKSLDVCLEMDYADGIGQASFNLANRLAERRDTTAALELLEQARAAFARAGNTMYLGQVLGNMGRLRTSMHRYDEAKMYLDSSMKTLAPMGPEFLIAPRIGLTELYGARGDHALAIETGEALRSFADSSGTLTDAKNLYLLLYEAYKAQGNTALALERYEHARELIDSLTSDENKSGMLRQEYKYSYDKRALSDSLSYAADMAIQQKEVQKQKVVRNGFIGGFVLVAVFAGVFFFQRNRIGREKARSEALLLNILPAEVAEELKAKGEAQAVQIDEVTVLFTDFKGFTAMSETMGPRELVRDLNECFSAFDAITSKYGIEKIKTIGDAYMAAGGLPTPNTTHATDVIKAALEMRDFIAAGKAAKIAAGQPYFEIRIGVHTGPVVAGIVGVKKFQYDIWGDTVNTASRMESSGEVGKVNISGSTYAVMKDVAGFSFTPRGKVQAKGKGEMEMYFVESIG